MNLHSNSNSELLQDVDKYEILELIGTGSSAIVYKARQKNTGQSVALKLVKITDQKDTPSKQQLARFEKEVKLCAEINHPYIVKLLDKGYTNSNVPFVIFEYVSGITLKEYILQNKKVSYEETKELMGQVLDALSCAHTTGIVHRDLKPENIMVSRTGTKSHIKVLDFGIGAFANDIYNEDLSETTSMGTPSYSSPEQLRGDIPSMKSDIYSWGLLLVECLTGKPAIWGQNLAEIYHQQLNLPRIDLPSCFYEHPLGVFLEKVLDKNPQLRSGDANQLFQEYQEIDFSTLESISDKYEKSAYINQTVANNLSLFDKKKLKRPITVLKASLIFKASTECKLHQDTLEELELDQLKFFASICQANSKCEKIVSGNTISIYFGHPHASNSDARNAAVTAFEILNKLKVRSIDLKKKYGTFLDIRIALHTGTVLTNSLQPPQGIVIDIASDILHQMPEGEILVSDSTRQLLDGYYHFEKDSSIACRDNSLTIDTYRLIKENIEEAFYNLRSSSARRKMYGRENELKLILDQWEEVSSDLKKQLLIQGEPGIGKSKLIYEIKKLIKKEGYIVYTERCLAESKNKSLYPILQLFKNTFGLDESLESTLLFKKLKSILKEINCNLSQELPVLCSWMGIPVSDNYIPVTVSPEEQKKMLFNTLKKCLVRNSDIKKYLFILEDVHWADPTTIAFLNNFFEDDLQNNYLFLLTARPEFNLAKTKIILPSLSLNPLGKEFAKEFIKDIVENKPIEDNAINFITENSDGVPIFVEELTKMMLLTEQLYFDSGKLKLKSEHNNLSVPATLKELLHTRLDQLGLAKETAQIASTFGRDIEYKMLEAITLKDRFQLLAELDQLISADLMYYIRTIKGNLYVFRHALFKEVAYESQTFTQRKLAHINIAEIISNTISEKQKPTADEAESLAYHLYGANKTSDAVEWSLKATELLVEKSANQETVNICKRALDWIQELPADESRNQTEFKLRQILITNLTITESFGSPIVGEQLEAISKLLENMVPQEEMYPSMYLYSTYYMMRGNASKSMETAKLLALEAQRKDNKMWEMVASIFLGVQLFNNAQLKEAEKALERALYIFNPEEHTFLADQLGLDQYVLASSILASVYAFLGKHEKITELEKKAFNRSELLEKPHTSASLFLGLSCTYYYLSDKKKAFQYSQMLIDLNKEINSMMFSNYGNIMNGWALGDLEVAKQAMSAEESSGMLSMRSMWYSVIATIEIEKGLLEEAKNRLKMALSFIGTFDGPLYSSEVHRLLGVVANLQGNTPEANDHFSESLTIARAQNAGLVEEKVSFQLQNMTAIIN